jgi:hypothetical protein
MELSRIREAARARVLAEHTSAKRAEELEKLLQTARSPDIVPVTA